MSLESVQEKRASIRESDIWRRTQDVLVPFTHIRCLALGSPTTSKPSMYQLAYLMELAAHTKAQVSVYDPIFTEDDVKLFEVLQFLVEQDVLLPSTTLYFLPHADLLLANHVLETSHPQYYLGNDITTHTGRLTASDLHTKYPVLSHLVHLAANGLGPLDPLDPLNRPSLDGFTPVRRKKNRFVPPKLEYNMAEMYFTGIEITPVGELGAWSNAFNDLAWHHIASEDINIQ